MKSLNNFLLPFKRIFVHNQKRKKSKNFFKTPLKGPSTHSHLTPILTSFFFSSIVTIACYHKCLDGQFTHDDVRAVLKNADVVGANTQVFQHDFWGGSMKEQSSHKSYRPLTVLTFRLGSMMVSLMMVVMMVVVMMVVVMVVMMVVVMVVMMVVVMVKKK